MKRVCGERGDGARGRLSSSIAVLILSAGILPVWGQADWYVATNGSDANDGMSWGQAFATIQKAYDEAHLHGGNEIWVAEGTYVLSSPIVMPWDPLKPGIKIKGGFPLGAVSLSQQDWVQYLTVIDGGNAVVPCFSIGWIDLIEGFTITRCRPPSGLASGGAINIQDCGGTDPQPVLRNLVIRDNGGDTTHPPAFYEGGGIYVEDCSPWIVNASVSANRVWGHGGGLFARDPVDPVDTYVKIINSTFTGNHAENGGGGIGAAPNASVTIDNSILWGNSSGDGLSNELLGGTFQVSYSDVDQSGFAGVFGNIRQDPQLFGIGRYHLGDMSPCIDAGSNGLVQPFMLTDFDGDGRILDGGSGTATVDMGADEYIPGAFTGIIHVDGTGGDDLKDGQSWATAVKTVQQAVALAGSDTEIWVKVGTYALTSSVVLTPVNTNLGIYGGFAGNETLRGQRSTDPALTVIDGQHSYSCFSLEWSSSPGAANVVIDGFTLDRGVFAVTIQSADGTVINNCRVTNATAQGAIYGGGGALTVTNSFFSGNRATERAGAIHMNAAASRLTVLDSTFVGNLAEGTTGSTSGCGGAIRAGSGTISHSRFFGNLADRHGGAVYDYGLADGLIIQNSLFSGNQAGLGISSGNGGATYGPVEITSSTIYGNTAPQWYIGGVANASQITNSILWNNDTVADTRNTNIHCTHGKVFYSDVGDVSFSDIANCQTPYGNINSEPFFADPDGVDNTVGTLDDGLSLQAISPAIDAGDSSALAFGSVDLAGAARHNDDPAVADTGYGPPPMIDMGAYERQASTPASDYDLTMSAVGSGTTSPATGVHNYSAGSVVTVSATADPGWLFTGWTGWVTDPTAATTSVTMNWDRTVTANFVAAYTLSVDVQGDGTGTITSSPAGISCPPDCSEMYQVGTDVTLSAAVAPGTVFDGWVSTECTGKGDCDVTVNADVPVVALCNLEGSCGLGDAMTLDNMTVDWTHVFESCSSITTGGGFVISSPGDVLLRAGTTVEVGNGLSVGAGTVFEVQLYPDVGLVPAISVSKTADPTTASQGDPITYTIDVENTGEVQLTEVSVLDTKCHAAPTYQSGDDGDNSLEVGETWIYSCSGTAEATTFTNIATATFVDGLGVEVSDSGMAEVTVDVTACQGTSPPRFVDLANGTIYDCWTDLIWLKDASCSALPYTDGTWGYADWANANLSAAALADGTCGLTDGSVAGDWRLPTGSEFCGAWSELDWPIVCDEALGLINDNFTPPLSNSAGDGPWVEGDAFLEVYHSGSSYWVSDEVSWDATSAWKVSIGNINLSPTPKSYGYGQVWPVRGTP